MREDGRPQEVLGLTFQEITDTNVKPLTTTELLAGVTERMTETAPAPAESKPMTSADVAGRRLIVLLFDVSSMQPEDVQRAVESAEQVVTADVTPTGRGGQLSAPTES